MAALTGIHFQCPLCYGDITVPLAIRPANRADADQRIVRFAIPAGAGAKAVSRHLAEHHAADGVQFLIPVSEEPCDDDVPA